jgi:tetratricopeptide (TPR) repeat protein
MTEAAGEQVLEDARTKLEEGDVDAAREGFLRAVELRPDDVSALIDLGHLELALGRRDASIGYFHQAVDRDSTNVEALRALVDLHRRESRFEDALAAATQAAESRPDDVVAALDAGNLALELGRLDDAEAAFRRARNADDEPDHEVYGYHAMIELEFRRERWRRALDLAVDATRVDRLGRTTDVLAYAVSRVFGAGARDVPAREAVDRALAASRAEHRRVHLDTIELI